MAFRTCLSAGVQQNGSNTRSFQFEVDNITAEGQVARDGTFAFVHCIYNKVDVVIHANARDGSRLSTHNMPAIDDICITMARPGWRETKESLYWERQHGANHGRVIGLLVSQAGQNYADFVSDILLEDPTQPPLFDCILGLGGLAAINPPMKYIPDEFKNSIGVAIIVDDAKYSWPEEYQDYMYIAPGWGGEADALKLQIMDEVARAIGEKNAQLETQTDAPAVNNDSSVTAPAAQASAEEQDLPNVPINTHEGAGPSTVPEDMPAVPTGPQYNRKGLDRTGQQTQEGYAKYNMHYSL
eukprot:jgi/Chrzof1/8608/Cz03g17070.t1